MNLALIIWAIALIGWLVFDTPAKVNKLCWAVFQYAFLAWCIVIAAHVRV